MFNIFPILPAPTCGDHQFKCKNNECINQTYVCDHRADCYNGADEVDCGELSASLKFLLYIYQYMFFFVVLKVF